MLSIDILSFKKKYAWAQMKDTLLAVILNIVCILEARLR